MTTIGYQPHTLVRLTLLVVCCTVFSACSTSARVKSSKMTTSLPAERYVGSLEEVMQFNGSMPTGVTVAHGGRIFVNYPRWGDPVPFTVAEIRGGKEVPYPNAEINKLDPSRASETFVSVQSVVADARNRLWILDTGSIKMQPTLPGGPKLV